MKTKIQTIFTVLALVGTIKAQSINVTPTGVGIGTTTPGMKAEIANGGSAFNLYLSGIAPSLYFGEPSGVFPNGNAVTSAGFIGFSTYDGSYTEGKGDLNIATQSRGAGNSSAINFLVPLNDGGDYSQAMKIHRSGNVTIGNTGAVGHISSRKGLVIDGRNQDGLLEIWGSRGGKTLLQSVGGHTWVGTLASEAGLGDLYFTTGKTGGLGNTVAALKADTGYFGIGTTNPTQKLEVAGDIKIGTSIFSAQRPNFALALQGDRNMVLYDNGAAVWNSGSSVSDIRTKEKIVELTTVLETIDQIRVVEFNFKAGVYDDKRHVGFIAQEIEALYPDFVYTEAKSGRKLVQYDKMSTIAVAGVKELKAEYQAALTDLKKEIADLRAEVELLKSM